MKSKLKHQDVPKLSQKDQFIETVSIGLAIIMLVGIAVKVLFI